MYNSILVNILSRLWLSLEKIYRTSFLAKILGGIGSILGAISRSRIVEGSFIKRILVEDRGIFEAGLIHKFYAWLVGLVNRILDGLHTFFQKLRSSSRFSRIVENLFGSKLMMMKSYTVFLMTFSLSMIGIAIFVSNKFSLFYIGAGLVILLIGYLVLYNGSELIEGFKRSKIINWLGSIISVDEGGRQWW